MGVTRPPRATTSGVGGGSMREFETLEEKVERVSDIASNYDVDDVG